MEKEPIGNRNNMMQFLTDSLNEYNERCRNLGKQMTSADKRLKFIGSTLPSLLIWQKWRQERKMPNKMKIDELIALQLKYRRILKMQEKNRTLNTNTCTPSKFKDKFLHQLDCIAKLKNYILEEKLIKKKIDELVIKEQDLKNVVEKLSASSPQSRTVKIEITPRVQKDIVSVTSDEKYSNICKAPSLDINQLSEQFETSMGIEKCDESTSITTCLVSKNPNEEDTIGDIIDKERKDDNSEKNVTENELCKVIKKLSCAIRTLEEDQINVKTSLLSIFKEVKETFEIVVKESYVNCESDSTTVKIDKKSDVNASKFQNKHEIELKTFIDREKIKETIVIKPETVFAKEATEQIREMEKEKDIEKEKLQRNTKIQHPIQNIFEPVAEHTEINYKILEDATERLAKKTQMLVNETEEHESEEKFVVERFLDNEKPKETFDKNYDKEIPTEEKVKIYPDSKIPKEILRNKVIETTARKDSKIYQAGEKSEEKAVQLLTNEKVKKFLSYETAENLIVKEEAKEHLVKVKNLSEVTKQNGIKKESEQSIGMNQSAVTTRQIRNEQEYSSNPLTKYSENKEVDSKNRKYSNSITITGNQTSQSKVNEESVYPPSNCRRTDFDDCACNVCKCLNCEQLIANIFVKVSATLIGNQIPKAIEKDENVEDHNSSSNTKFKNMFDNCVCKSICNCSTCNKYTKNVKSKISRNLSSIEEQIIEPTLNVNEDSKSDQQTEKIGFDDTYTRSKKQFDKLDPELPRLDNLASEINSKLLHKCKCRAEILQEALSILISNEHIDNSTKEKIQICLQSLNERIKNLTLNESIDCHCSPLFKNIASVTEPNCSCRPCPPARKNMKKCTCSSPCPCTACRINNDKIKGDTIEQSQCTCSPCIPARKNMKKCTCSSPCTCSICAPKNDTIKEEVSKKSECSCWTCIPAKKQMERCTCKFSCVCTICKPNDGDKK